MYFSIFGHISKALSATLLSSIHLVAQNLRGKTVVPATSLKSSLLAGESWNRYHNALRTYSIFHSVAWHPVQKAPWTMCRPQLPIFNSLGRSASCFSLSSHNNDSTFQFTLGPSMDNWRVSYCSALKVKTSGSQPAYQQWWCPMNCESKYCVTTLSSWK